MLHLTIKVDEGEVHQGVPQLPYSAKASLIRRPANATPPGLPNMAMDTSVERSRYLYYLENFDNQGNYLQSPFQMGNPNQPEFDDGQVILTTDNNNPSTYTAAGAINGTGSSRYAEVCWFLRNGTLYRRMLLIREPYATGSTDQPEDKNGNRLIAVTAPHFGNYTAANLPPNPDSTGSTWQDAVGRFWYDFDYSAFHDPVALGGNGLTFHTVTDSLNNEQPPSKILGSFANPPTDGIPPSLGIPCLRFGNSLRRGLSATPQSPSYPPREFLLGSPPLYNPATYIGRFTLQETAHSAFTYPSSSPAAGGPFQDATALGPLNSDGLVPQYATQTGRRGEDIVMTNVHSFDIQVWDDGLAVPQFVNLGNGNGGYYGSYANPVYGNRYDTWHPNPLMGTTPYRPVPQNPVDANGDMVIDAKDLGLGSPNEIALKGIRIHMRFYDQNSGQMRDMTFTFPLLD